MFFIGFIRAVCAEILVEKCTELASSCHDLVADRLSLFVKAFQPTVDVVLIGSERICERFRIGSALCDPQTHVRTCHECGIADESHPARYHRRGHKIIDGSEKRSLDWPENFEQRLAHKILGRCTHFPYYILANKRGWNGNWVYVPGRIRQHIEQAGFINRAIPN